MRCKICGDELNPGYKKKVSSNAASCPHCEYEQPGKIICPKCKSKNIKKNE